MKSYIDIVLEGEKFSPNKLKEETNLNLKVLAEFGEIGKYGLHKGKPMPYGLAIISIKSQSPAEINQELNLITDELLKRQMVLINCGVEEITLDIENSPSDDLKINREIIKKISELNANIEFSPTDFEVMLSQKREIQRFDLKQVYNTILHDKLFMSFEKKHKERISYILEYKIQNNNIDEIRIAYSDFMSVMTIYIIKYSHEKDINKIPDFQEVLKHYID